MEKANAFKIAGTLYIDAPKKKFLPSYVYYLLMAKDCDGVCFKASKHIYKREHLKGLDDWKEVTKNESK